MCDSNDMPSYGQTTLTCPNIEEAAEETVRPHSRHPDTLNEGRNLQPVVLQVNRPPRGISSRLV